MIAYCVGMPECFGGSMTGRWLRENSGACCVTAGSLLAAGPKAVIDLGTATFEADPCAGGIFCVLSRPLRHLSV